MTEFEDIQRLVRLKRHEMPPEGFVDGFITAFHERQRSELLRQSSRSLLWERLATFFEGRPMANMAVSGAAIIALVAVVALSLPSGKSDTAIRGVELALDGGLLVDGVSPFAIGSEVTSEQSGELSPLLLSKHFAGGYADEARANFANEVNQQRPVGAMEVMPGLIFSEQK